MNKLSSNSSSSSSVKQLPSSTTRPSKLPVNRESNLNRSASSSLSSVHSEHTTTTATGSTVKSSSGVRRSPSSNEILTENIDDFKLNEKVYVNGTRLGTIKFLGETQFAPGVWAGIELVDAEGKNDGSVAGVRYFECQAKYGVFVRPQRLTKKPISQSNGSRNGSGSPNGSKRSTPSRDGSPTSALKRRTSLKEHNGVENGSLLASKFRIDDRILVNATSGTKLGTLKFLGPADFASGLWAGVELDEPTGKNDGSVAGKRYFSCEMKYGLFAPINKISPAPLSALKVVKKSRKPSGLGSRQRSGSQESLQSVSSTASSTHRAKIRLGVTSLSSAPRVIKSSSGSSNAANVNASSTTSSALHDVLKEKEQHIDQLLRERDLEREDVARATAQADQLEDKLRNLQQEHQKMITEAEEEINELKRLNSEYEEANTKLNNQLDDERKKIEDLTFRLEEETIIRSDLETQIDDLKQEIESLKSKVQSNEQFALKSNNEQVEALLDKIKSLESQKDQELFSIQEDLVRKEEQVFQLEASLEKRNSEICDLQTRICEFEHELEVFKKKSERQLESIDELNHKIRKEESQRRLFIEENTHLKAQLDESKKKVRSLEERIDDISTNKSEISMVGERVKDLEKELEIKEDIERALEESLAETKEKYEKVEFELNRLTEELHKMNVQVEEEIRKRKVAEEDLAKEKLTKKKLEEKFHEIIKTSGSNSDLVDKLNFELAEKQREFDNKEKQRKDELESLNQSLSTKESEIKDLKIQLEDKKSFINVIEKKAQEQEKLIREHENKVKLFRDDVQENQKVINDLRQQLNEQKSKSQQLALDKEKDLEFKIDQLQMTCRNVEDELDQSRIDMRKLKDLNFELEIERDRFKRDFEQQQKLAQDRQNLIDEMRSQVENIKAEFIKYQRTLQDQIDLSKTSSKELEDLRSELQEQKQTCQSVEDENESLRDENRHLREKMEELRDTIEQMEKRHKDIMNEIEYEAGKLHERIDEKDKTIEDLSKKIKYERQQLEYFENEFKDSVEKEKKVLENKIKELEDKVKVTLDASTEIIKVEKTNDKDKDYEQQIEFLNSVIVDMQKKNDELKSRMQVLEEIGMTEFETATSRSSSRVTNGHIRAPRIYCDICDVFDLHETEDCPQQELTFEETKSHSHYSMSRREERAYCDNCEMFGHWTENCVDNDTY